MVKQYITLKQFTRNLDSGFTLVELLVSMVVATIVISMAFSAVLYNRRLYVEDQARINVNQNLRAAMDFIGTDIKQAGERITDANFPVIRITGGSELVLRRRLDFPILPVCQAIAVSSTNRVFAASSAATPPPGCNPLPDSNSDGYRDNLEAWRNYRCKQDNVTGCQGNILETVKAFIYDGNGNGEYFDYVGENGTTFELQKLATNPAWQYAYTTGAGGIYLLEERKFNLLNNILQLSIDGKTPQKLVNQLSTFEVKAVLQSNPTGSGKGTFPETGDRWQQINSINVNLTAIAPPEQLNIKTSRLTASEKFFPRNALSR